MAEELAKIDTEVKVTEPKPPAGGRLSFEDIMGVRQPFTQKKGELREEIKGTEGEILAGQQRQKEMAAEGKMAVEQQTAAEVGGAQQRFQQKMQAEPLPAFVPSQDNFKDIAGLFSLIGVVGMVAGKSSGLAAMNAMNGMLEGYRAGRNDLYKRERDVFDKNFKTMLQKHAEFRKEMDDAIKLAQTNRQAGLQAAELAAVRAGSEIVKAQVRRGDLLGAYETVKDAEAGAVKALEMVNANVNAERQAQVQAQAMEARFRQQQQLIDERFNRQEQLIQKRAAEKAPAKAPTEVERGIRGNAMFLSQIDDIIVKAEQLAKSGDIRGIGVVLGRVPYDISQLAMSKDERDLLQDFAALTNAKLKDQSGATVTGAEFARQRGVLPMRTDEPNVIIDKLKNWKRLIAEETGVFGKAYPDVVNKYGVVLDLPREKSRLVKGLTYKTREGDLVWNGSQFVGDSEDQE